MYEALGLATLENMNAGLLVMAGVNGSDVVVLIILALLVALVVWRLWKGRKSGHLSCGGCTGCSGGSSACCGSSAEERREASRLEHMSDAELKKLHQAALAQRTAKQNKPTQPHA